jgi:hypothetical protein
MVVKEQLKANKCRGGLVGYDAALTQLRSGVRFPSTVNFVFVNFDCDSRLFCFISYFLFLNSFQAIRGFVRIFY